MSHETHRPTSNKPTTSFSASFWFVVILAGLFIAAVNFVNVMGHDEGHEGAEEHGNTHEATSNQTLHGETGVGVPAADTTHHMGSDAAMDTTHTEGH